MLGWRWNVTAAKKLAEGHTPNGRVSPTQWAWMLELIAIDEDHAAQVDLSEPLIVVTVPNGGPLIIDGWHRLHKALNGGAEKLSAVLLSAEEEVACRIYGGEKDQGYIR